MPFHEQQHPEERHPLIPPALLSDTQPAVEPRPFAYHEVEPVQHTKLPPEGVRIGHLGNYLANIRGAAELELEEQATVYIADVRLAHTQLQTTSIQVIPDVRRYKVEAEKLATRHWQHSGVLGRYVDRRVSPEDLLYFFTWNLMGVIALPAMVFHRNNQLQVLRQQTIEPVREFSSLEVPLQKKIVQVLADEWQQLCGTLYYHDPDLLKVAINHAYKYPLAIGSVTDLRDVLRRYPPMLSPRICRDFLCSPYTYMKERQLPESRKPRPPADPLKPLKLKFQPAMPKPQLPKDPLKNILSPEENALQIELLHESPDVNPALLESEVGALVPIGPQDAELPIDRVNTLIDQNLQFLGRSMHQEVIGERVRGLQFRAWWAHTIGSVLSSDRKDMIQNVTLARTAVDGKTLLAFPEKPPSPLPAEIYIDHVTIAAEVIKPDRVVPMHAGVILVATIGALNLDTLHMHLRIPEGQAITQAPAAGLRDD